MIRRIVNVEIACDQADCDQGFELTGFDMAVWKLRHEAQSRGWYTASRNTTSGAHDFCPSHVPPTARTTNRRRARAARA